MAQKHPISRAIPLPLGLLLAFSLAGCGDYTADYPALAPTDSLLAPPALPSHAQAAAKDPAAVTGSLEAERNRLEGRAKAASSGGHSNGDLAERARKLRERAEALRTQDPAAATDCTPGADGGVEGNTVSCTQ